MHNAPAAGVDAKRKSRPNSASPNQESSQESSTTWPPEPDPKPSADQQPPATQEHSPSPSDNTSISRVEQGTPVSQDSPITLRGTKRGLEVWVTRQDLAPNELAALLKEQLNQSPSFFSGGDAILHFDSAPKPGVISALEALAQSFDVRVVAVNTASIEKPPGQETAPRLSDRKPAAAAAPPAPARPSLRKRAPQPSEYSDRSSSRPSIETRRTRPVIETPPPSPHPESPRYPLPSARYSPAYQEETAEQEAQAQAQASPMMVPGPIRSGSCLEAPGHLVVVGDVNPGAEIRAEGNIVVLGSLRGIAHAGTQGGPAFILALKLQPQQLRISTLIARAGDADNPASGAEVAYAADQMIVVDEYQGRLPSNIANSI